MTVRLIKNNSRKSKTSSKMSCIYSKNFNKKTAVRMHVYTKNERGKDQKKVSFFVIDPPLNISKRACVYL